MSPAWNQEVNDSQVVGGVSKETSRECALQSWCEGFSGQLLGLRHPTVALLLVLVTGVGVSVGECGRPQGGTPRA